MLDKGVFVAPFTPQLVDVRVVARHHHIDDSVAGELEFQLVALGQQTTAPFLVANEITELRLALIEFTQIVVFKCYSCMGLVHGHGKVIFDMLYGQVLADRFELIINV